MAEVFANAAFDASNYSKFRNEYPAVLYQTILAYHDEAAQSAGGPSSTGLRKLALDLGCGPGQVTKVLSELFERVLAVDPSESMIRSGKAALPADQYSNVEFRVGSADNVTFVDDSTVDLLTSGTAAHWYPAEWWKEAARVCKKGATVALWSAQGRYIHPRNANAERLQELLISTWDTNFRPHYAQGNLLLDNLYDDLPLPQDSSFSEVKRVKWNVNGHLDRENDDYACASTLTLDALIARQYTYGPVNTYNAKHPEHAGSPDHPLERLRRQVKDELGYKDDTVIEYGQALTLLLLTRQ